MLKRVHSHSYRLRARGDGRRQLTLQASCRPSTPANRAAAAACVGASVASTPAQFRIVASWRAVRTMHATSCGRMFHRKWEGGPR